jgi:hypothetical protein
MDDTSKLGMAEEMQKSAKHSCRVLFLLCSIRAANATHALDFPPCSLCPLWLTKMLVSKIIKLVT